MARQVLIEHEGKTYSGTVMEIRSTRLGEDDHGILTVMLDCSGDGVGVGLGGYGLDAPKRDDEGNFLGREPTAYGLDHIVQIMRTAGVDKWEDLPGTHIIALFDGSGGWGSHAVGMAHLTDENRVLIFKDHAESWKEREPASYA